MKFGQLILRRIVKIVATKCQILRLKCTKIDFGCSYYTTGAPPDPLTGFNGPTSKGRGHIGREGKREREGRQGRGRREGGGKEGRKGGEGTPVCIFKFSLE